jgi:hypothetical protein
MARRHQALWVDMLKPRHRHETHPRHATVRWRDVWCLGLLALFALQGIVAQGHSHVHAASGATVVTFGDTIVAKTDDRGSGRGAPSIPDSPTCSLCQSLGAGSAPLALAILLLVPALERGFERGAGGEPVFTVGTVSYSWTSRGPPSPTPLQA